MNTEKRAVVLACVTLQFDCDRIIKIAKQIADDTDCDLRVLSVLEPTHDYTEAAGDYFRATLRQVSTLPHRKSDGYPPFLCPDRSESGVRRFRGE